MILDIIQGFPTCIKDLKVQELSWHIWASQGLKNLAVSSTALARNSPTQWEGFSIWHVFLSGLPGPQPNGFTSLATHEVVQISYSNPPAETMGTSPCCYYKACLAQPFLFTLLPNATSVFTSPGLWE